MTLIMKTLFGSHVYGTNLPESDHDYKAVYLPTRRDILLQRVKQTNVISTKVGTAKNTAADIDYETFSLQEYIQLLCEGQTVALDMLFTPEKYHSITLTHSHGYKNPVPIWGNIWKNRHRFHSKKCVAFVGYCRKQANKYGIKGSRVNAAKLVVDLLSSLPAHDVVTDHIDKLHQLEAACPDHIAFVEDELCNVLFQCCNRKIPLGVSVMHALKIYQNVLNKYGERALQAANNEGVDWKALMHAVRIGNEAIEFLDTGFITQPRPEAGHLLNIRQGKLTYADVAEEIEGLLLDVEQASLRSKLPDEPDWKFADEFVADIYESVVRG